MENDTEVQPRILMFVKITLLGRREQNPVIELAQIEQKGKPTGIEITIQQLRILTPHG